MFVAAGGGAPAETWCVRGGARCCTPKRAGGSAEAGEGQAAEGGGSAEGEGEGGERGVGKEGEEMGGAERGKLQREEVLLREKVRRGRGRERQGVRGRH